MTDESERQWPTWVSEAVAAVHASLDGAETAPELGAALTEELAAGGGIAVAWIGTVAPNGIRIRSAPPGTTLPGTISIGNPAETLTGGVEADGESRLADPTDYSDTARVLEAIDDQPGDSDIDTAIAIPLVSGEELAGVLHLFLTDSVQEIPPILPVLGRTVGQRLRAFDDETQLRRERRRLEELRSLVSHDLGNPLNIASGRIELAKEDIDSSHLDSVESALERIDHLTSEGVELVEVGHQPEDVEEISLTALAEDCWTDVGRERGTLSVEETTLVGERKRLRRLVNELIDNAFVHSDGAVTVELGPLTNAQGFYVADDGPGIPADERAYVLDTGYTTVEGRDGLGLSLVSEIAGAHGWDISLDARTAGGTRVELITSRW
jgi:signal transduction histidine kinase